MQYGCQLLYSKCCHCLPQVTFERPVLCLGSEVCLRIGPESSVQLTTTYLDERMRLGRGGRGSRFVFISGGCSDQAGACEAVNTHGMLLPLMCWLLCTPVHLVALQRVRLLNVSRPALFAVKALRCSGCAAGMDQVGLGKTTATGWAMLGAAELGLVAGTVKLAHGASLASRAAAVAVGLLAGAIATVIWRGGQQRAPAQHQTE